MPASAHPQAAAPHTTPAAPAYPPSYDGPRVTAADFFTFARGGRAQTTLPPLRDGDSVSCPLGTEWLRHDGRWIIPGRPGGLTLPDRTVTTWWHTRHRPGSRFALVHRLTCEEAGLITHSHYTDSILTGDASFREPVSGAWLRSLAWQAARTATVSAHLELPSGIVTLHSRLVGDVFFHPTTTPVRHPRPLRRTTPPSRPAAAVPGSGAERPADADRPAAGRSGIPARQRPHPAPPRPGRTLAEVTRWRTTVDPAPVTAPAPTTRKALMHITPSGYVRTRPDVLDSLREEAARTPAHHRFVETAITAFEQEGPDATPLLDGCGQRMARMIFNEVAEAYDRADRARRDAASTTTLIRDFTLPYTSYRREAAQRALRARQLRSARGLDRLRVLLTIG